MKTKLIEAIINANPEIDRREYRCLEAIKAGNYYLSVQGSNGHYCSPREALNPDQYFSMELAIFNKNKDWFNISLSSIIRKFPRYKELMERADGKWSGHTIVFGYVPVDLINDLYIYLFENI